MRKLRVWLMAAALSLTTTLQHCHTVVRINPGGVNPAPAPKPKHLLGDTARSARDWSGFYTPGSRGGWDKQNQIV